MAADKVEARVEEKVAKEAKWLNRGWRGGIPLAWGMKGLRRVVGISS